VAATDGGLLIPALGSGWDPARTARFAGPSATNADRIDNLLKLAEALRDDQRRVRWSETLVVAVDGQIVAELSEESPDGLLAETAPDELPEGSSGFWVPYVWLCPEHNNRRLSALSEGELATRADHWSALGARLSDWCNAVA
jgi:hypothetical protein